MRNEKPSTTAYKVAINLITLNTIPKMKDVLPSGTAAATADLLLKSGAARPGTVRIAQSPKTVWLYKIFDPLLPGQFEAFAYRKAFCERHVREGIAAGATQVLVLGAGYDTLGWRLAPEFTDVSFVEIDHPATARLKAEGVAKMGERRNLTLLAEDLGKRRLEDVLLSPPAWDMQAQSVFVAEGLVMYLVPEAVADLFRQCASVSGPGSRFAFSYIPAGPDGRIDAGPASGLMLWLQKTAGEPWLWSIAPGALPEFLEKNGWKALTDHDGVSERHGVEYFVAATR